MKTILSTLALLISFAAFAGGDPAACPGSNHRDRTVAKKNRNRADYCPQRKQHAPKGKYHKHKGNYYH